MGYQFIHIESYGCRGSRQKAVAAKDGKPKRPEVRKWSAREIAAEAMRVPDACPHVQSPKRPVLLYGCSPLGAAKAAEKWASSAKDARGHALRADGLAMLAGVVSMSSHEADSWSDFRRATIEWLKGRYGPRLLSVVEHTDEMHPHLHFYVVPLDGERFEVLHPGRLAAAQQASEGAKKGAQNTAYKKAMQRWQDEFQHEVAARFAMTRLGPARRRLTRAAWKSEQAQAKALAKPELNELLITPEDVKKRVTRKRFLGDEYESAEELAARLSDHVRDQAQPLAVRAAREKFMHTQITDLRHQVQMLQRRDETKRADDLALDLRQARQQIDQLNVATANELAEKTTQLKQADKRADLAEERVKQLELELESALKELQELKDKDLGLDHGML